MKTCPCICFLTPFICEPKFLFNFIYLFWLRQVLVAARGTFVAACGLLVAACKLLVVACMQDLVPPPGIEPRPPALGAQSLTHWTTREVPKISILKFQFYLKYRLEKV